MDDPLRRFLNAQDDGVYDRALSELRAGAKRSHWMWFIFPQIAGLGSSEAARFYALSDLDEAAAYSRHPILGPRLEECTRAMLGWADQRSAEAILGSVDAMKFKSSLTLFEAAADQPRSFARALEAFYAGERDQRTLALLA